MPPRGNPFARGTPAAPELSLQAGLDVPARMREPEVPDGGASALLTLSDRFDRMTERLIAEQTRSVAQSAFEAGLVDGDKSPDARMEGGGRVYRDAYNRAATESGLRRLEISGRETLDRLATEHATNPTAFAEAAQAWRDGAAADLPPTTRTLFTQRFDAQARPYANHVRGQSDRFVADQDLASFNEAMPARLAARDRAAGAVATDPQAVADLRREDAGFLGDLIGRGPKEAFVLDGKSYPADPTRTGTLRLPEMQRLWEKWTRGGRANMAMGHMRASDDPEQFVRDWDAANLGGAPGTAPSARAVAAKVPQEWVPTIDEAAERNNLPKQVFRALIGLESGGNANAVSPKGARGPAQIMPSTAANPGYGMRPLPADQIDNPAQAIPWAAEYLGKLRQAFGGDLRAALAAYNAGEVTVRRAGGDDSKLPAETQRYLETLLPSSAGLPLDEAMQISRAMHSELARMHAQQREGQSAARARLEPLHTQNIEAAKQGAPPPNDISDDEFRAAGHDPIRKRQELASQQHLFTASQDLANATTPERVQEIANRFAVGTDLFMADPKAAAAVLDAARARGAQISGVAAQARIADLTATAEATGKAEQLGPEEGRAAGLRPEQIARINEEIALKAEIHRRTQEALRLPPAEQAAAMAQLSVEGARAAENRLLLQAYAAAATAQRQGLKDDPAGYVANLSRPAQDMMARAGQSPETMGNLIRLLDWEQERLGVPEAERRPLPDAVAKRLVAELDGLPTEHDKLRRLSGFAAVIESDEHRARIFDQLQRAGLKEHLIVGAAIARRAGEALGARIAGELAVDASKLGMDATTRRTVTTGVQGVWDNDDRLGGLRRAQAVATAGAGFVQAGEHEQRLFEKVALARQGGTGTHDAREIYEQMFGGRVIVNRPDQGVLVSAPAGTDPDKLEAGLRELRRARLAERATSPQQLRALESQAVWVDHGAGRYALYSRGLPAPLAGVDGQPILTTAADALAARAAAPATPADLLRATRRLQWRQRGGIIPGFAEDQALP